MAVLLSFITVSFATIDMSSSSSTIVSFMLLAIIHANLPAWLALTRIQVLNISLMFSSGTSIN